VTGTPSPYSLAPYALETTAFRFPAIATCAGRAPLGGDRDLALGVYTAARLALALLPPTLLDNGARGSRAERAKVWLSGLTMPQPARMALLRAFDATLIGAGATADALTELAQMITGHVDPASQQELAELASTLRASRSHSVGLNSSDDHRQDGGMAGIHGGDTHR
jgi:hypothetical protein